MKSRQWRRADGEDGMALIMVLGISTLVYMLMAIAFDVSTSALNSSVGHNNFEQAVHVGEHGIDQTLARIQKAHSSKTEPYKTPTGVDDIPAGLSAAAEKAWVLQQIKDKAAPIQKGASGEYAVVKPGNRNVVFAVSWIPSRANPRKTRMLKSEYIFSPALPTKAVLAQGALDIGGGIQIKGVAGGVHSNSNLLVSGSSTHIEGGATASGSFTATGTPVVVGSTGGAKPLQPIPRIKPEELYHLHADYAPWYDLCPDGTVRAPASTGPCLGKAVTGGAAAVGWEFKTDKGPYWQNKPTPVNGVFYVHHASALLASGAGTPTNPWQVTVLAGGKPRVGPCAQDFGDIFVEGGVHVIGKIPDTLFVSGRDLLLRGKAEQKFEGVFSAWEQIHITGNASMEGAVIAQDNCDTRVDPVADAKLGTRSPVAKNYISGGMTLTFNADIEIPVDSIIRTTLWLEL